MKIIERMKERLENMSLANKELRDKLNALEHENWKLRMALKEYQIAYEKLKGI